MSYIEIIPNLITLFLGIFGGSVGYATATRKNQTDTDNKNNEIKGASWEPFVEQMKEYFQERLDSQQKEIDFLKNMVAEDSKYQQYVLERIYDLRNWATINNQTPTHILTKLEWKDFYKIGDVT